MGVYFGSSRRQRTAAVTWEGSMRVRDESIKPEIVSWTALYTASPDLPSLGIGNHNYMLYVVFGRFPAELGPETRSNGSGSKNGAERTQN